MRTSKKLLVASIALLVAFGGGYFYGYKTSPETEIKEVDKTKKNVTTTVKEVVRADGSRETVTVIVDKSKESSKKVTEITPPPVRTVTVSATVQTGLDFKPTYGILLQKPFLADKVEVGLGVNQKGEVMGTLGWNF